MGYLNDGFGNDIGDGYSPTSGQLQDGYTTAPPLGAPNRLTRLFAQFRHSHFHPRPRPRGTPPTILGPQVQLPVPNRGPRDYLRRLNEHFKTAGYRGRGKRFTYGGAAGLPVRASQVVLEALDKGVPGVRASQIVQMALEKDFAPVRASQIVTQALCSGNNPHYTRASQFVVEVLVPYLETPDLLVYPNLIGLMPTVTKRPKWSTGAGVASSGREVRIGYWTYPQWEWELSYDLLADNNAYVGTTASDIKDLIGFFLVNYGSLQPFLFQDIDDYQVTGQPLGDGDGVTTTFLFTRTYGMGSFVGTEPVGVVNTGQAVTIYVNGVAQASNQFTINTTVPCGNIVTLATPPAVGAVVSADFQFWYYCRFSDDSLDFDKFMRNLWDTKKVTIFSLKG